MIITWFGQSCFKIQGEKSILVTDPYDNSCGLRLPRLAADIVTASFDNNVRAVKGLTENGPFIINQPGEYEIKNTFIYGIASSPENKPDTESHLNIIYRLEMDGMTLAHLGQLNYVLTNGEIEKLEGVDILMIPVGGFYTIDAKQATQVISQIEPRIVIPMCYQIPNLKLKNKIADVKTFCKEIGVCPQESEVKLKINKKDLPQEDLRVVMLKP